MGCTALTGFSVYTPCACFSFVRNLYKYATLLKKCLYIPLLQGSDKGHVHFHCIDVEMSSALHKSPLEISVRKSTISHPDAQPALFTSRTVEKDMVIGYYYDSLVYADRTKM